MSVGSVSQPVLEVAHVLFMDVVAYSRMAMEEQRDVLGRLQDIVRATAEFQRAEARKALLRLPTGDGMALVFFEDAEAPLKCAIEVARAIGAGVDIKLRMGVHTGPVYRFADINANLNVAGGAVNIAQRVMDCGDAGHILASKAVADVLGQTSGWQELLHDIGEAEVKHGVRVHLFNVFGDGFGNPALPEKVKNTKPSAIRSERVLEAAAPKFATVGRTAEVVAMVRRTESGGLRVYLDEEAIPNLSREEVRERPFAIDFPVGKDGKAQTTEISLKLESPEFEPRSQTKVLKIPPDADSQPCTFFITPRVTGALALNLELLRGEEVVVSRSMRMQSQPEGIAISDVKDLIRIPLTVLVHPQLGVMGVERSQGLAAITATASKEPIEELQSVGCAEPPRGGSAYAPVSYSDLPSHQAGEAVMRAIQDARMLIAARQFAAAMQRLQSAEQHAGVAPTELKLQLRELRGALAGMTAGTSAPRPEPAERAAAAAQPPAPAQSEQAAMTGKVGAGSYGPSAMMADIKRSRAAGAAAAPPVTPAASILSSPPMQASPPPRVPVPHPAQAAAPPPPPAMPTFAPSQKPVPLPVAMSPSRTFAGKWIGAAGMAVVALVVGSFMLLRPRTNPPSGDEVAASPPAQAAQPAQAAPPVAAAAAPPSAAQQAAEPIRPEPVAPSPNRRPRPGNSAGPVPSNAYIGITSIPGARIEIDGRFVGNVPGAGRTWVQVPPGFHTVQVLLPGYRPFWTTVNLRSGGRLMLRGAMRRDPRFTLR